MSRGTVNFTARVVSRAFGASRTTSIFQKSRAATFGLLSVGLGALFLVPTSVPAAADPPLTVAEAKALTAQLQTDAAAITSSTPGSGSKSSRAGRNSG